MKEYVVKVGDKYLTVLGTLTGYIQCAQRYWYEYAKYMAEEKGGEVVEIEEDGCVKENATVQNDW